MARLKRLNEIFWSGLHSGASRQCVAGHGHCSPWLTLRLPAV